MPMISARFAATAIDLRVAGPARDRVATSRRQSVTVPGAVSVQDCARSFHRRGSRRGVPAPGVASPRCRRGADAGRSWPWPRRSWLAFVVYTVLASLVDVPRVHPDEVRYAIAGSSLVEGEGLSLRGGDYGFGPLYALVLAGILLLTSGLAAAYDLFKAANALFFALTAIPVYLLARRLVSEWWAVLAAALSVAIPSSISVATVMTESLAFFTAAWALYAIMLALERPTTGAPARPARRGRGCVPDPPAVRRALRHLATRARARLADPAGEATPDARRPPRALAERRAARARGGSPREPSRVRAAPRESRSARTGSSGAATTRSRWRSGSSTTSPTSRSTSRSYPLAVAPIVLWSLLREGRAGSERSAAFAALFLSANAIGLLVVAAFNSTPYAYDRLHDRYAFYFIPLWLIVFVAWLAGGLPRPLVATATGVVLALALPAILPFGQLANEAGIDTVPGALWVWLESPDGRTRSGLGPGACSPCSSSGSSPLGFLVPRRFRLILPARRARGLRGDRGLRLGADDRRAGERRARRAGSSPRGSTSASRTTRASRSSTSSPRPARRRASPATRSSRPSSSTSTVDRAAYIGDSIPDGIPLERVEVESGRLVFEDGSPLVADFVYTQPGIELDGRAARAPAPPPASCSGGRTARSASSAPSTTADVRTADCAA